MSVNKFGRYSDNVGGRSSKSIRGPPGFGYHVLADNNNDMKGKRLVNLAEPKGDKDAVTKGLFENHLRKNTLVLNPLYQVYDAGYKTISRLGSPTENHHAVNKTFVRNKCLI